MTIIYPNPKPPITKPPNSTTPDNQNQQKLPPPPPKLHDDWNDIPTPPTIDNPKNEPKPEILSSI